MCLKCFCDDFFNQSFIMAHAFIYQQLSLKGNEVENLITK